jgi:DNA-binding CsgD family transcriptional regulator
MQLIDESLLPIACVNTLSLRRLIMFPCVVEKISNSASIQGSIFCNESVKNNEQLQAVSQVYLLQAVIESFVDGILILKSGGELLHTNECARQMCRQLGLDGELEDKIPVEIWQVCESLIESRKLFPLERIFMEVEVKKSKAVKLRIRARWLHSDGSQEDYIIVTLENCHESSQHIAIADAAKYGLTEREAEVWLLRRANLTYKEIAENLYITINTVKKHLKNIYAKQQEMSLC